MQGNPTKKRESIQSKKREIEYELAAKLTTLRGSKPQFFFESCDYSGFPYLQKIVRVSVCLGRL